ncbi:MAG: ABC transporter permease, partial [Gemmatimonadota bacterium]
MRTLRRRPLYATVAIVTLGLGIGAATAMFSVVDGVLLKPLPYDEPGRLVTIWQTMPDAKGRPGNEGLRWDRYTLTYQQYRDLLGNSTLYEGLAAYKLYVSDGATLTGAVDPVELRVGAASASLLHVLGVRPPLGRWFLPGEEASLAGEEGASVAVISHDLWQRRLGGSPETLGRMITVDGHPFTIVGVLPAGFRIHWLTASVVGEGDPGIRDIWLPIGAPGRSGREGAYSWETIGRLASGVTIEQARVETKAVMSEHARTVGDVQVVARTTEETRGLAPPLVLLFGATSLLLLIACANIAMLSMAELQGREHEITTRSALGASASRLVRLHLTESGVLAVLGSAAGAGLAFAATGFLVALAPPIPRLEEVGVDLRVLAFAATLGACAALFFGTVPSILASRGAIASSRHRSATVSSGRRRFSRVVVGMEIAITVMLLVAAGLLTRSLSLLLAVDPGFDTGNVAIVEVRPPYTQYPTPGERRAFFQEVLGQLEAIPGIGTVTGVSRLPFPGETESYGVRIEGREEEGWLSP